VGSYAHNQYLNHHKIYLVPVFMLLKHSTNLNRQRTTTATLPKTITYSLYSFIWQSDNFLGVSIIKYNQVVAFEKAMSTTGFRPPISKGTKWENRGLYLKAETEPSLRNVEFEKMKARLGILPSKTPIWRTLRLRQAVFRCSSVLYVFSPLWLRSQPTPLSRERCTVEYLRVFGIS
jgi:hypothetical protein